MTANRATERRDADLERFLLRREPAQRACRQTFETKAGKQRALFDATGLPGQMALFPEPGVPDEMVNPVFRGEREVN